uniref:Uncharacterized protein n=1 Tax=Vibrio phage Vc1 TaxID=1480731 RepID=A0A6M5C9Z8_9CAUD
MSAKYIDGVKGKYWSRGAMRRPFNFELYSLEGDKTNTGGLMGKGREKRKSAKRKKVLKIFLILSGTNHQTIKPMSAKYIDGVKGKYWSRGAMRRPFNFELYSLEGDKTNTGGLMGKGREKRKSAKRKKVLKIFLILSGTNHQTIKPRAKNSLLTLDAK